MEEALSIAVETGQIGFARLDRELRVVSRAGRISGWLPDIGLACCDSLLLFGMENDLLALQSSYKGSMTLPGIHVPEIDDGLRANVVITWDQRANSYLVLTTADYGAGEIEALLTAERRNKQIADERLIAETERANIQTRLNAVAQERARIARDLHDTLIQSMVGTLTQIRLVLKMMHANPEIALKELADTEGLVREGLDSARNALGEIRARNIETVTLGTSVRNALARLRARLNIEIALDMDPAADDLEGEVAQGLARVAEEALRNVERHARASHLDISLAVDGMGNDSVALLQIRDDGIGFDASVSRPGHFGLAGMAEQVELLGGNLKIGSAGGNGTKIEARIPLPFDPRFGHRAAKQD